MRNWKPITDSQRDGKIYWVSAPYPSGLALWDLKARFYRGRWWTSYGQQGWRPVLGDFTHYAPLDGFRSTQSMIGPIFRPEVTGVVNAIAAT